MMKFSKVFISGMPFRIVRRSSVGIVRNVDAAVGLEDVESVWSSSLALSDSASSRVKIR